MKMKIITVGVEQVLNKGGSGKRRRMIVVKRGLNNSASVH